MKNLRNNNNKRHGYWELNGHEGLELCVGSKRFIQIKGFYHNGKEIGLWKTYKSYSKLNLITFYIP